MDVPETPDYTQDPNADTHSRAVAHGSFSGQPIHIGTLESPAASNAAPARARTRRDSRSAHSIQSAAADVTTGFGRTAAHFDNDDQTAAKTGGNERTAPMQVATSPDRAFGASGRRGGSMGFGSGDTRPAPFARRAVLRDQAAEQAASEGNDGSHRVESTPRDSSSPTHGRDNPDARA
jgi:hypothetical protein